MARLVDLCCIRRANAGDDPGHEVGSLLVQAGGHVRVGLLGDADRGVPEALLSDPWVYELPNDASNAIPPICASVAQVWRRSCSRIGGRPARAACSVKVRENRSGCSGPPSGRQNTRPWSVKPAPINNRSASGPLPVLSQCGDGCGVQRDSAAAGRCLGRADLHLVIHRHHSLNDGCPGRRPCPGLPSAVQGTPRAACPLLPTS